MDVRYEFRNVTTSRVVVGDGVEAKLPELVAELRPHGVAIAFDPVLEATANRIAAAIGTEMLLPVHGDADQKRLDVAGELATRLQHAGATRATVVLALGGGTITDLVGFVAAIWLRGVPFVSCPTTTLAMCDAALGGKNGVDLGGLKNRLGTIRQPDVIAVDPRWLTTLPDELFCEGLVEVVKKAAVLDAARFAELERLAPALRARDAGATARAIAMAVEMKMAVVQADEREGDRRRMLNAGHTIGHALEELAAGTLRHGHAVAIGLVAECRAAGIDAAVTARVAALLAAIGAPTKMPDALRDADRLWQLARTDKKALRGAVPMCVPRAIGDGVMVDLDEAALVRALS
ncbi:MAG: 3-dehydroquinate synthase family protein [Planctomycetota bacterium]